MGELEQHRILILGWPMNPKQEWLKNYPFVTATRIYQEGLSWSQKRWMNASFHAPCWLQKLDKLKQSSWYGDWRNNIEDYDTVIIIDEVRGRDVFEYILARNPRCRICVFYDSPIKAGSTREPSQYRDLPIHFYTCDRKIAADYDIMFTPYFYIFSPMDFQAYEQLVGSDSKVDVFFLGEEKGDRLERLSELRTMFDGAGVKHDLRLVRKRHGRRYSKAEKAQTTEYMSYFEYLRHIRESKAILELVSAGQSGITQRPYEALFFQKKLITTCTEVQNYDFYCSDNVLVINQEIPLSETDIKQFINSPFRPVAREIKEKYTFSSWLQRLLS